MLGQRAIDVADLVGEELGLIDGRVRGGLDDGEEEVLVLRGRELLLREHVEGEDEQHDDQPQRQHDRAVAQRAAEHALVDALHDLEVAVDHSREAALGVAGAEQLRAHHRREGEGHDSGDEQRAGERERELAEQRSGEAALERDRRVDRRQGDGHGDDRRHELPRGVDRGLERRFPHVQVPLDVLDHDDGVVDDETDGQHDRQQSEEVDREAEEQHQQHRADERDRDGDDGNEHAPHGAEEEEDDDDDDDQRLGERLEHLVDRGLDVLRGVVRDASGHARGELGLDVRHGLAHGLHHVERVRRREGEDADEDRGLAVEADFLVVGLGAEDDVRDLAEAHEVAVPLLHDQLLELLRGLEVRVGDEVDRRHGPLRSPEGGEVVVLGERGADVGRRDPARGHPLRVEPHSHRERTVAEDVGALDSGDRAQLRLHDADEVVRDLVLIEVFGREAEVGRRELAVGRLQVDDRRLGLGGQLIANLGDLRLDLRQRGVGVEVELEVRGDRADALRARRLEEVDAVRAGDGALERRRDEATHEVRVGTDVRRGDDDVGHVAARKLAHYQRTDGLQPRDQNHEVDHHREDGAADEEVGQFHEFAGVGVALFDGCTLLLTVTAAPGRSLKAPEVTTSSPGFNPDTTPT